MEFKDRESSAKLLLSKLEVYRGKNPVVFGIPRGAMPMASIIAEGLHGELSAVFVHKIPFPGNEEFAIGCVGISGNIHLLPHAKQDAVTDSYIQSVVDRELKTLKIRQERYGLKMTSLKGRVAIIVDDGIATGATTICAVDEVRRLMPDKLVLVAAVSSRGAAEKLRLLVDEFIVLFESTEFFSVGQFFSSFPQVTDDEVIRLLEGKLDPQESHLPIM